MSNKHEAIHLAADVLVIGAGAAGMSAAISASEAGRQVVLVDRSLIGRGGATIMAQMTVAAALSEEVPDDAEAHFADTIKAGRGLCDPNLAQLVCEHGAEELRRLDKWKIGWARHEDGRIRQVHAPGHDRARCAYVDFLNSGPAVSKTLRGAMQRHDGVRRIGDVCITDIVMKDGVARGAVGFSMLDGRIVSVAADATIIATGGLTRLYRRNSASLNMAGDGYALALRAGATLIDMEFVQFFPIGHLAPRMIGMDPIMWDPFRYKLGGRLLNAEMQEFTDRYGTAEQTGKYVITRDQATYAILKEVEAGRGSPAGGAYLSFQHVPAEELRKAFGPVIDRLAKNGIDLTQMPIEVAPIAHYHMGGVRVDTRMASDVPGLYAAGEAIGGSNGANRLSGNAITECLVFGRLAGFVTAKAADSKAKPFTDADLKDAGSLLEAGVASKVNPADIFVRLQAVMADLVGPFRTEKGLSEALVRLAALKAEAGELPPGGPGQWEAARVDWFDLRNALLVGECVTRAALQRQESRGAHQREDFQSLDDAWALNLAIQSRGGKLDFAKTPLMEAAQ